MSCTPWPWDLRGSCGDGWEARSRVPRTVRPVTAVGAVLEDEASDRVHNAPIGAPREVRLPTHERGFNNAAEKGSATLRVACRVVGCAGDRCVEHGRAASRLVAGDTLIKKDSLSGNHLRRQTLTGAEINLKRLGTVPSATHADRASSAGTASSAINADHAAVADNGARRIDFVVNSATDPAPVGAPQAPGAHTLLKLDEPTVTASCINAGGQARVYVAFGSSVPADLEWQGEQFNNPGVTPVLDGAAPGNPIPADAVVDLTGGNRFLTEELIYRNSLRTISVSLSAGGQEWSPDCQVEGTAVAAPK
jgi:hypothetical protein